MSIKIIHIPNFMNPNILTGNVFNTIPSRKVKYIRFFKRICFFILSCVFSSSHYHDELGYAAAWLYRATNDPTYLTKAEMLYVQHGLGAKPWAFDWDDKKAGLQVKGL